MFRKAKSKLIDWKDNSKNALLVTGARQVGKTFIIREFLEEEIGEDNFIEFNLFENELAKKTIDNSLNSEDLLISEIMTLCPKKIEILDKSNSKKSRETIEIVCLLFEGKVTVIYSN